MKHSRLLLFTLFLSICSYLNAQNARIDVIHLKSGRIIKGIILEEIPNESIKIHDQKEGSVLVYPMSEVLIITQEVIQVAFPTTKPMNDTIVAIQQSNVSVDTAKQSVAYAQAQTDSTTVSSSSTDTLIEEYKPFVLSDSLLAVFLEYFSQKMDMATPIYKLYKTENTYNLIKLNTATGQVWQVQYGMNDDATAMEVPINDNSLLWRGEEPLAGRYELYPTNNMYTFILVDTRLGYCYQVQWSTSYMYRFRRRIW